MQTFTLRAPPRRLLETLTVFLLLSVFAVTVTAPFTAVMFGTVNDSEDALQQSWVIGWNALQLVNDPLTLYEAPDFYPFPHTLAYSDSMVPQSLLTLPVVQLTGNPALAHNLQVLATFILCGLGMYWLVRDWGGNFWGALFAGLVFAFGHYRLIHFGHLNLLSMQWFPLMLMYLRRALRRGGGHHWFLYGLFFVLSALSSFYYAFFTAAVVGIYLALALVRERRRLIYTRGRGLIATHLIVLLVLLPFGIPYIQVARDYGLTRSLDEIISFSATPLSYFASATNTPALAWTRAFFPPPHPEATLSPGWIGVALAVYALYRRMQPSVILPLVVIALVGFTLSLGPQLSLGALTLPLPFQLLYQVIPGFAGSMRAVSRWGALVLLATAALDGLGMSELTRRLGRRPALVPLFAVLVGVALWLEYSQAPVHTLKGQLLSQPSPPAYTWLKGQSATAAVELPMAAAGQRYPPDTFYQYYSFVHHTPLVNGYSGFAPPFYDDLVNVFQTFPSYESLALARALGVRYILVHTDEMPAWARAEKRLADLSAWVRPAAAFEATRVYEVLPAAPPPAPRFELVLEESVPPGSRARGALLAVPTAGEIVRLTPRATFDLRLEWRAADDALRQTENVRVLAPLTLDQNGAVIPFSFTPPDSPGTYHVRATLNGDNALTPDQSVAVKTTSADNSSPVAVLEGWTTPTRAARAGDSLKLILKWRMPQPPRSAYAIFAHVLDEQGNSIADVTGGPNGGSLPLREVHDDDIFVRQITIPIPRRTPQGAYRVVAGLFDVARNQVVPVPGPDGQVGDSIEIGTAWIAANWNEPPPTPPSPLDAQFGNGVDLRGFELATRNVRAGQSLPLTLYWFARALAAPGQTVFVHLVNGRGEIVAQADSPPRGGAYPTAAWNVGEWVRDPHALQLPADLAPGNYTLRVGWYQAENGARAHVITGSASGDFVSLATITVK